MKSHKLVALLLLPVLAGPLISLHAQVAQEDALALISELQASQTPTADIVSRLMEEGLDVTQILPLLTSQANTSAVEELLAALIAFGIPPEDAAAMVVAMHSGASAEGKIDELGRAGISRELASSLLVVLATEPDSRERMEILTGELGLTVPEAAQLLIFLTIQPSPRELMSAIVAVGIAPPTAASLLVANGTSLDSDAVLEAIVDQGLSLAEATNIITTTESTAAFAQPLAEIVSQPFTPSNFSNDALTGAAGGGVSTSQ